MNVLFYYDPVSHRGDALWRRTHPQVDSQMYRGLVHLSDKRDANVKIFINEWCAAKLADHGIAKRDVITVREEAYLRCFPDPHADVNRLWFKGATTSEQLNQVAGLVEYHLNGFRPDVVITWTPAPFLRALFPDALILHKEMGLFQRAPYPATFFLDPLGFYEQSLLSRKINQLKDAPPRADQVAALDGLRNHFFAIIEEKSPLASTLQLLRTQYRKLLLLPLQYNHYFSFDSRCSFRTQMGFAEAVLKSVPKDVGVVLTRHRYGNLTDDEVDFLRERFHNLVHLPEAERYQNSSDLILPHVDGVVTVTSTIGLKALFWRKKLITLGTPYLGWLDDAHDLVSIDTILEQPYHPSKDHVLAWFLLCYSIPQHFNGAQNWTRRFLDRLVTTFRRSGACELYNEPITDPEHLCREFVRVTNRNFPILDSERCVLQALTRLPEPERIRLMSDKFNLDRGPAKIAGSHAAAASAKRRVLFLYASGRWNASGLYLQELARQLTRLGVGCMILAEHDIPPGGVEDGVVWRRFAFEGYLLQSDLKKEIGEFAPDLLYVINVRFKPMRTALELHVTLGAPLAVQSEDDDLLLFEKFYWNADPALLELLDKPDVTNDDIKTFAAKLNWSYTLDLWSGSIQFRDIEPILRILCYRLSAFHSAIWCPLAEKLARAFAKPTVIVPPVVDLTQYDPAPLSFEERSTVLKRFGIRPNGLVIFLAGTIYDFSPEFETFLKSLALASQEAPLALVIAGRSRVNVRPLVSRHLEGKVPFHDLGTPNDDDYHAVMRAADVIAAPGYPDRFNRLRLSSRLVKAMAFAKPIFTYRCGFGESLVHGQNAILTEGIDPQEWATKLLLLRDRDRCRAIGRAGRAFAEQHFDSAAVAEQLAKFAFPESCISRSRLSPVRTEMPPERRLVVPPTRPSVASRASWQRSRLVRKVRKLARNPRRFFADSWLVVHLAGLGQQP